MAEVDECRVQDHLVKGESQRVCHRCEGIGVIRLDVRSFPLCVLRCRDATDIGVDLRATIARVDSERSAPLLSQRLKDIVATMASLTSVVLMALLM